MKYSDESPHRSEIVKLRKSRWSTLPAFPAMLKRAVKFRLAPNGLAAPATGRAGPTIAMYFFEPLRHLIDATGQNRERPIRQLTATLFATGKDAVIIRYGGAEEIAHLAALKPERVYYVIDDDLRAAAPGDGLPADYRRRLIAFRDGPLLDLLPFVTHVVAPSAVILAGFPTKLGYVVAPAQVHLPGSLAHHAMTAGPFEIVAAGTRGHLRDISHIAGGLAQLLCENPGIRLTTLLGDDAPQVLRDLPNATHLAPLSWPEYCAFAAANRFHAAVAPGLDTRFNRARSQSKIHDHAGFGAAGLYSARPPFKSAVRAERTGLLLADEPSAWLVALRRLASDRALTANLAKGGQELSVKLGSGARVRAFWTEALDL